MTVSQDKLNKIRLLIKKAQGTDNPHESAAFMNKAQELMASEGVDMMAVQLSEIGEARVRSQFSVSRINPAENTIMHACADAFGCKLLWIAKVASFKVDDIRYRVPSNETWAEHLFVGSKDRLSLATYAAEVLVRQLKKQRDAFATKRSAHYWDFAVENATTDDEEFEIREDKGIRAAIRKQVTKDADSYAAGWAWEIQKRVVKFALNDQEQLLLAEYTKSVSGETKAKESKHNKHAYTGMEDAKKADLYRPIDESGATAPLLGETKQMSGRS